MIDTWKFSLREMHLTCIFQIQNMTQDYVKASNDIKYGVNSLRLKGLHVLCTKISLLAINIINYH